MAEFGKVHRYEPTGSLHGILRCRSFTQDDAHVFCTEEQMKDEVKAMVDLIFKIYKDFDFKEIMVKFSDRPEKRIGEDKFWNVAEKSLKDALDECGIEDYGYNPGEGAFYGRKLEFVLKDAIGRDWQAGTIQLDLFLPERFNATYIDSEWQQKMPRHVPQGSFWFI